MSTLLTLSVVIVTCTGTWVRLPAAFGSVSDTTTVIVAALDPLLPELGPLEFEPLADDEDDEEDEEDVAVLTEEITPVVTDPSGRVTETLLPTATSVCMEASRFIVTTGVSELPVSTVAPAAAEPPGTAPVPSPVIWIAPGRNTACPSGRVPVWVSPRCACSSPSAYAVSPLK